MACLATSAIASILGVDTNNCLALEVAEVVAFVSTFCVVGHAAEIEGRRVSVFVLVSFLAVAVCRVDFAAGGFSGSFLVAALLSSSVVFVPRSKRTLRTCLRLGGVARGGVAARDVTGDNGLDGRGTTRRVSRCGDDDAEDSLRALFWRRPLGGDGDLFSEGVDAPDPAGIGVVVRVGVHKLTRLVLRVTTRKLYGFISSCVFNVGRCRGCTIGATLVSGDKMTSMVSSGEVDLTTERALKTFR